MFLPNRSYFEIIFFFVKSFTIFTGPGIYNDVGNHYFQNNVSKYNKNVVICYSFAVFHDSRAIKPSGKFEKLPI